MTSRLDRQDCNNSGDYGVWINLKGLVIASRPITLDEERSIDVVSVAPQGLG